MSFNINKLVSITISLLRDKTLEIMKSSITRNANDQTNIWNQICSKYFGTIDFNSVLNLSTWWKRNTNNYQTLVKDAFCFNDRTITIPINRETWTTLQKYKAEYESRSTFRKGFHDYLSQQLQDNGINCWLHCKYNWLSKSNSQKKNCPWWKGVYVCTDKGCNNSFEAKIDDVLSGDIRVVINCKLHAKHARVFKKISCYGEERFKQAQEIMVSGISNTHSDNILHNITTFNQNGMNKTKIKLRANYI